MNMTTRIYSVGTGSIEIPSVSRRHNLRGYSLRIIKTIGKALAWAVALAILVFYSFFGPW